MADRLGLRHQPAAAGSGHRESHRDRQEPPRHARPGHRDHRHEPVGQQRDVRDPPAEAARVRGRRRGPPAPAVQRPRLQHLHPGLLQPRLEAGRGPQTPGRAGAPRDVLHRARPGRRADRQAGQQVEPRVRPVLRGARPDGGRDRRRDEAADRGAQGQHPARPRQARSPGRRDGTQGLRVQRPRGGPWTVL